MKLAFITGITGQDGSYLAELLIEKGYKVYGIVRRTSLLYSYSRLDHIRDKIHIEYGDMSDGSSLTNYITSIVNNNENFEVFEIYNLAAQSHVQISFEIPEYTSLIDGIGTLKLLEAIRTFKKDIQDKIRFYQAGTSEMYGAVLETPQKETTPFNPQSPYACAKVYSHFLVKNYREGYGMFTCNGILFNHESPRRGANFVTMKIVNGVKKIVEQEKENINDYILTLGNIDSKRDWGHSKDYVLAIWKILQHKKPDDFVIATEMNHTILDFVKEVFGLVGLEWKKFVETNNPKFLRPAEVPSLKGDSSKAKKLLKWKPKYKFKDICKILLENDLAQHGLTLTEAKKIAIKLNKSKINDLSN